MIHSAKPYKLFIVIPRDFALIILFIVTYSGRGECGANAKCPLKSRTQLKAIMPPSDSVDLYYTAFFVISKDLLLISKPLYCLSESVKTRHDDDLVLFRANGYNYINLCSSESATPTSPRIHLITADSSLVKNSKECTHRLKCNSIQDDNEPISITRENSTGEAFLQFNLEKHHLFRNFLSGYRKVGACFELSEKNFDWIWPWDWHQGRQDSQDQIPSGQWTGSAKRVVTALIIFGAGFLCICGPFLVWHFCRGWCACISVLCRPREPQVPAENSEACNAAV